MYQEQLPGVDVLKLLSSTPRLLTQADSPHHPTHRIPRPRLHSSSLVSHQSPSPSTRSMLCPQDATTMPNKLEALQLLLPTADVTRLVRSSPQLLEYDVDGHLRPKLHALRRVLHRSSISLFAARSSEAARLATSKVLRARRAASKQRGASRLEVARRDRSRDRDRGGPRSQSMVGMLRLAALDLSVRAAHSLSLSAAMRPVAGSWLARRRLCR